MCTFLTTLPTRSKTSEQPKRQNLMVYIKPTEKNVYYRFRLLAFTSPSKSDRDYPFIERYIHTVWVENEDGKRHSESIVCPVTKYVKSKWNGDPMKDCPMCNFANANFVAWKESGWKDKESARKNKEFGRKFQALIPVYVIDDPIHPANNNHFRVIEFNDKDIYKKFKDLIFEKSKEATVFNGANAVDFCIRMETVNEVRNEGQPNEYVWKHNVIKRMVFSKTPSTIPQITKEAIDAFEFDETYYVSNTLQELKDFYNSHVRKSTDDIPDEDEEVEVFTETKKAPVVKTNSVESSEKLANKAVDDGKPLADLPFDDEDEEDLDKMLDEPKQAVAAPKKAKESIEDEVNDLLDEDEDEDVPAEPKKQEKSEPLSAPPNPMKESDSEIDNLGELLKDIY